jgi:hypothetical protein
MYVLVISYRSTNDQHPSPLHLLIQIRDEIWIGIHKADFPFLRSHISPSRLFYVVLIFGAG